MTRLRRWVAAAVVAAGALGAWTWVRGDVPPSPSPPLTSPRPDLGALRQQADQLPVKGRAPKTGYSRATFGLGDGWPRFDGRCDTRDQILARDLRDQVRQPIGSCNVTAGTLDDPYTGMMIRLDPATPHAVEIDHVVPLGDAWVKGAQQWTPQQRARFAVDPDNLLAVDGPSNSAKRDGDSATWLPPNKAFRCEYAGRQVEIKTRYQLWVTQAEKTQLQRLLMTCPDTKGR